MVSAVKSQTPHLAAPASPWRRRTANRLERLGLLLLLGLIPLRAGLGETPSFEVARMFRNQPAPPTAGPAATFYCLALILAVAAVVAAGRLRKGAEPYRPTGAEAGGVLLLAAAALAVGQAGQKHLAAIGALDFLGLVVFFLTLRQLLRRPWQIRLTLAVILGTGAMVVAKCPYQRWVEWPATVEYYQQHREELLSGNREAAGERIAPGFVYDYERRLLSRAVTGYFAHPNVLGSYLILVIMTGLAVAADRARRRAAAAVVTPLVVSLAAGAMLGYSQSKGAAAALIAALAAWGLGRWASRRALLPKRAWAAAWLAVLLIGVGLGSAMRWAPESLGRSMLFRFMYWEAAGRMIADRGLLGVGPGNFGRHFTRYKPVECPEDVDSPHSWVVQMAAEWGVLGLGGLIVLLAGVSRRWVQPCGSIESGAAGPSGGPAAAGGGSFVPWVAGVAVLALCGPALVLRGADPGYFWLTLTLAAVPLTLGLIATAAEGDEITVLPDDPLRSVIAPLCGGLFGFLLHAGVDLAMHVSGAAMTFFALLAVVSALTGEGAAASAPSPPEAGRREAAARPPLTGLAWATGSRRRLLPAACIATIAGGAAVAVVVGLARPAQQAGRWLAAARAAMPSPTWPAYVSSPGYAAYGAAAAAYRLDSTAGLELAEELLARGGAPEQLRAVIALLDEHRRRDPNNASFALLASDAYQQLFAVRHHPDDLRRAVEHLRQAVEAYPSSPNRRLALADLLEHQARLEGRPDLYLAAAEAIEAALALDALRVYVSPMHRLADSLRAELRDRAGRLRARAAAAAARPRNARPRSHPFAGDQVVVGFPAADEAKAIAFHQDFRRAGSGVVLAGHRHAVGPGGEDGQQVARFQRRQQAVSGEAVRGLTDRPHHRDRGQPVAGYVFAAGGRRQVRRGPHRPEEMPGVIQRRPEQIGHAGIHDDEVAVAGPLSVEDAGDQDAGVRGDAPSGFHDRGQAGRLDQRHDGGGVVRRGRGLVGPVVGAVAAAEVECFDVVPGAAQVGDKLQAPADGGHVRIDLVDGGAEVEVDPPQGQMRPVGEGVEDPPRLLQVHAELGLAGSRGGMPVGPRVDVGVDAQRRPHPAALPLGLGREGLQFRFGLDVEPPDAGLDAEVQLGGGLAHAGEHEAGRVAAGLQRSADLAARHHVEARSLLAQQPAQMQIRAALDGVAHQRPQPLEGPHDPAVVLQQGRPRVDIDRRINSGGDGLYRGVLREETVATVAKVIHIAPVARVAALPPAAGQSNGSRRRRSRAAGPRLPGERPRRGRETPRAEDVRSRGRRRFRGPPPRAPGRWDGRRPS